MVARLSATTNPALGVPSGDVPGVHPMRLTVPGPDSGDMNSDTALRGAP